MSGLVVLEGRWENNRNISVKGLFDLLMEMQFENIHEYHFENFATNETLRSILGHVCGNNTRKNYIYIGAHGDDNGIHGSVDRISRTQLNNILRNSIGGSIKGIFFGACLFGNENNAGFFFERDVGIRRSVEWIAGYGESVDWIQSSAFDMIFWQHLLQARRMFPDAHEREIIGGVCDCLKDLMGGMMRSLDFQAFRRTPRRPYEPEPLINWE
ncbi:hypothetical protein [Acidocella sp. C78]|uniref:hypothetical protein n=1 Tax=Acidocella sp. C78 TaxID=1671486 RepID=UPI00191BC9BD|nr:hypothetical protein [Acidocella sp. C78]